jgi:hypothetical protein
LEKEEVFLKFFKEEFMKKFIICLALVATLNVAAYAGVIGNWETGYDGWGNWVSNAVAPPTNFTVQSTYGVTLNSSALKVVQASWAQTLALDLSYAQRVDLKNNNAFSIDFSVAPGTAGGRLQIAQVVLNAEGRGFTAMTITNNTANPTNNYFDFWNGSPARTMTITGTYDPLVFGSGSGPGIPGYAQIVIAVSPTSQTDYYFDNARLTPEPATIALLGLGLALLRKRS